MDFNEWTRQRKNKAVDEKQAALLQFLPDPTTRIKAKNPAVNDTAGTAIKTPISTFETGNTRQYGNTDLSPLTENKLPSEIRSNADKLADLQSQLDEISSKPTFSLSKKQEYGKLKDEIYQTKQEGLNMIYEGAAKNDPDEKAYILLGKDNPLEREYQQYQYITTGGKTGELGNGIGTAQNRRYEYNGVSVQDMTDEERDIYNYWYAKNKDNADKYLETIRADVNARTAERESAALKKASEEHPVVGVAANLLGSYATPLSLASAAAAKFTGKPYDPNTAWNRGSRMVESTQEGLTGNIENPFLKFLADTGLSTAQYLSKIPLGAGAALAVMSSGAAGQTAYEARKRGASTDQALTLGTIAGIAEAAFEKIPLDNITKAFKGGSQTAVAGKLKSLAKTEIGKTIGSIGGSALEEGTEELLTEYVNNIADLAIMGDNAEINQYRDQLIASGMDPDEAKIKAALQYYLYNPAVSFAGGALSGGALSAFGNAWSKASGKIEPKIDAWNQARAEKQEQKAADKAARQAQKQAQATAQANTAARTNAAVQANTAAQSGTTTHVDTAAQMQNPQPVQNTANTQTQVSVNDADLMSDAEVADAVKGLESETVTNPVGSPTIDNTTATGTLESNITNIKNPLESRRSDGKIVLDTAETMQNKRNAAKARNDTERTGYLAGVDENTVEAASILSQVFGRPIIFESDNYSVNGKFQDGTVWVNPKNENAIPKTIAHELMHSLEGTNQYQQLLDYIRIYSDGAYKSRGGWEQMVADKWTQYSKRYDAEGRAFTDNDAEFEVAAEFMEQMFSDNSALTEFANNNRSAAARIWYKLRQFASKIRTRLQMDRGNVAIDRNAAGMALRDVEFFRDKFADALRKSKKVKPDMTAKYSLENQQAYKNAIESEAINDAEEINREKALALKSKGFTDEEIYNMTGWFWDNDNNFMVNHEAPIYLYGPGESRTTAKLRSENEQLKKNATEKAKKQILSQLKQDFVVSPEYKPSLDQARNIINEIANDLHIENKSIEGKKRKWTRQLLNIYDMSTDTDSSGQKALDDHDIYNLVVDLATEMVDAENRVDFDKLAISERLRKALRVPVNLDENSRRDFSEGWGKFRKSVWGKIMLQRNGTPVDTRYQELTSEFPEWFPEEIIHPAEQLRKMVEVYDYVTNEDFYDNPYYMDEGADIDYNNAISSIAVKLMTSLDSLKDIPRSYADKLIRSIEKRERRNEEATAKLLSEAEQHYREKIEENKREYEEKLEERELSEQERKRAQEERRIRRGGDLTEEDVRKYINNNEYVKEMSRLWDARKYYREEFEAFEKVDIEAIEDKQVKAEVKALKEQIEDIDALINRFGYLRKKVMREDALKTLAEGNIRSWKDKGAGVLYSVETMPRIIRDISRGDKLGEEILTKYITPLQNAEASVTRFINENREMIKQLNISLKPKKGDKLSESQFMQEYYEALDNIEMLKTNSGKSVIVDGVPMRGGRTLEEWNDYKEQLLQDNPGISDNTEVMAKIERAANVLRDFYDKTFELVNNQRIMYGYKPIDYQHGYFPHYNDESGDGVVNSILHGLGIEANPIAALPTSINGLTAVFRPGIKYMPNANHRSLYGSDAPVLGAIEGFDRYVETAAEVIFMTEGVQNLRALSDAIRYSTTEDGVKKQYDMIKDNDNYDTEQKESLIEGLFASGNKYMLRNFVVELEEYTNILAGKRSLRDRQYEQLLGRKMYDIVKSLESRVAANMVALNPGSWLSNFIPLTQGAAIMPKKLMLKAINETIASKKNDDGFISRSAFLTNREGRERLVRKTSQKVADTLTAPMQLIDMFTAEVLVRTRYAQNLQKGLSESEAMNEADQFISGMMGGRTKSQMPTIFNQSNPVIKLFTQFQLEVMNQYHFMFKDLPREANKNIGKLIGMLFQMAIGGWLYNELYEAITGRRSAFDPIDILNDTVGDISGYKLPNIINAAIDSIDEDKRGDIFKTEKKSVKETGANLAENVLEQVPFIGGLLGGGRIPIGSALPDIANIYNAATGDLAGSTKAQRIGKEIAKPLFYTVLPFGGGQLKKASEGISALAQGGSYTLDSEGNKQLQYPMYTDTPLQAGLTGAQSIIFGKTATSGGREWIEKGFDTLNAKETTAYDSLVDSSYGQENSLNFIRTLTDKDNKQIDKVKLLYDIDVDDDAKEDVYKALISDSDIHVERINKVNRAGIPFNNYLELYAAYLTYEGDSKKNQMISEIDGMDLTNEQKDVMYTLYYKETGLSQTPWHSWFKGITLPEISLPDFEMPELNLPEINISR